METDIGCNLLYYIYQVMEGHKAEAGTIFSSSYMKIIWQFTYNDDDVDEK